MHRASNVVRPIVVLVAAALAFAAGIAPAAAHVEPDPSEAPKGGSAEIAFRVPTERDDASTVKVAIAFPTDHPIPSVSVEAKPGWKIDVAMTKLAAPVKTDDGEVSEAVSQVTWSGGKIESGEYGDFTVSLESIPTDTDSLVFKTLQTYSDGQVVRWIEPTPAGGEEPEHPAPTVKLVAATAEEDHDHATATTAPAAATTPAVAAKDTASKDDVDSARTIGIAGGVLGALGIVGALAAVVLARRRTTA